jgi:hypothetical protein
MALAKGSLKNNFPFSTERAPVVLHRGLIV